MDLQKKIKGVLVVAVSLGVLSFTVFTAYMTKGGRARVYGKSVHATAAEDTNPKFDNLKNENPNSNVDEMRGVWISHLDLRVEGEFTEAKFKQNYLNILEEAKRIGLNTVIVQIRPFSDALYPSKIFPWSHILTGTQGMDPGFDPLEFMINAAHKLDIKFQAWIVPMRVRAKTTPEKLCDINPAFKWMNSTSEKERDYVIETNDMTYYDPEYPQVRRLIMDGVCEVVQNYDVDGISFDDYFYPEFNLSADNKFFLSQNKVQHEEEITESMVTDRRKKNINLLISEVYSAIKNIKKNVVFGVCPQANLEHAHKGGAEVELWGSTEGYVDYICPEIYTNSVHPRLPFEQAAVAWRNLVTCPSVKYYVGLALYKTGTDKYDKGTWLGSNSTMMNQVNYLRSKGSNGFAFFSGRFLKKDETKEEIVNVMKVIRSTNL